MIEIDEDIDIKDVQIKTNNKFMSKTGADYEVTYDGKNIKNLEEIKMRGDAVYQTTRTALKIYETREVNDNEQIFGKEIVFNGLPSLDIYLDSLRFKCDGTDDELHGYEDVSVEDRDGNNFSCSEFEIKIGDAGTITEVELITH